MKSAMHWLGAAPMIAAIVVASVIVVVLNEFRLSGLLSLKSTTVAAWSVFALNAALSGIGAVYTPYRFNWLAYLLVSITCMILIGAATPLTALWILLRSL